MTRALLPALVLLALALAGCTAYQGTDGQQAAGASGGSFALGGQYSGKTGTEHHTWQNAATGAQVSWGGQQATGSLRVTIHDAAGKEVYDRSHSFGPSQGGGVEQTQRGTPGAWRITVQFTAYTGQGGLAVTPA